jgi:cephalosporin hydroxylase
LTGGLLWQWEPHLPLDVGGALSLIGVIVFLATSWHSAPRAAKVIAHHASHRQVNDATES